MTQEERFVRAIQRYQNFKSHLETRCRLLEKAFDEDTVIFDFNGLETIIDTIVDMSVCMFPNLEEEAIRDNIEWYLYEAVEMNNPTVEDNGTVYVVNSPELLYYMLRAFNDESENSK